MTKLTPEIIERIRAAYETRCVSLRDLGLRYGVSHETIRLVLKRRHVRINPRSLSLPRKGTS